MWGSLPRANAGIRACRGPMLESCLSRANAGIRAGRGRTHGPGARPGCGRFPPSLVQWRQHPRGHARDHPRGGLRGPKLTKPDARAWGMLPVGCRRRAIVVSRGGRRRRRQALDGSRRARGGGSGVAMTMCDVAPDGGKRASRHGICERAAHARANNPGTAVDRTGMDHAREERAAMCGRRTPGRDRAVCVEPFSNLLVRNIKTQTRERPQRPGAREAGGDPFCG